MAHHARLSASGSKRFLTCPGSIPLVDSLPAGMRRGGNDAARLGTAAHGLGEHCLRERIEDCSEFKGVLIWLDADEDAFLDLAGEVPKEVQTKSQLSAHMGGQEVSFMTRVDDRMVEGVQLYLDTVYRDLAEMGEDVTAFHIEQRFDLSWLRPDLGGTGDAVLHQFMGLLRVIDYKNGRVAVEVEDNTQGLYYALGAAKEADWLFDEVEVVIVQPNSAHEDGRVRRWRVTRAELEAFQARLAEGHDTVREAEEAFAALADEVEFVEWASTYLVSEPDICQYCDALPTCPAARARGEALAVADFAEDEPPKTVELTVGNDDEAALARLMELVKWAPFLDKLTKAAKALAERRATMGLPVPGYKLVAGRANRVLVRAEAEVVRAITEVGFKATDCYTDPEPALKSPAQLEKLGKKAKTVVQGVWNKDLNEGEGGYEIEPLAQKGEGKPTLVPEDDPREALAISAADDFADDGEEAPE